MCGNYSLPWDVYDGVATLDWYPEMGEEIMQTTYDWPQSNAFRGWSCLKSSISLHIIKTLTKNNYNERLQLSEVMGFLELSGDPRQCSDPRDLVYGILSFVNTEVDHIIPDYRKSVSAVYTELTRALVRQQQNLMSLCISNEASPSVPLFAWLTPREKKPSWVPDYCHRRSSSMVIQTDTSQDCNNPFNCCQTLPFETDLTLSESSDILRIQCVIWDTISYAYQVDIDFHQPEMEMMSQVYMHNQNIKKWCVSLGTGLVPYPTGEEIARVIYRTIRQDNLQIHERERLDENTIEDHMIEFHDWCSKSNNQEPDSSLLSEEEILGMFFEEMSGKHWHSDRSGLNHSLSDFVMLQKCTIFITDKGYIGVLKGIAEKGDEICVANGACFPLIVRSAGKEFQGRSASIPDAGFHTLIGGAYVHGIIDGEVIDLVGGEAHDTVFLI